MTTKLEHTPIAPNDGGVEIFHCLHCESTVGIALTAPHECSDPDCPGDANRKKLEAYDAMAESHARLLEAVRRVPPYDGGSDNIAWARLDSWREQFGKPAIAGVPEVMTELEHTPELKSETPGIDRLRELNGKLRKLLLSSHPGLTTWRKALSETLMEMADFAGRTHHLRTSHDRLLKACESLTGAIDAWQCEEPKSQHLGTMRDALGQGLIAIVEAGQPSDLGRDT